MPHINQIITRKQALKLGLPKYFTGKPCKHGHICERFISGHCVSCHATHVTTYQHHHKDKLYKKALEWRINNPEKVKAVAKRFRETNADKIKSWRKQNKQRIRKLGQRYRKINRQKLTAYEAARRASKLKATPRWFEKEQVDHFYSNVPKGYEVDHIIPLKNALICGLHVVSNLQYLPRYDNVAKNNRFCSYYETPDGTKTEIPLDN
jgi:hypothetical protein